MTPHVGHGPTNPEYRRSFEPLSTYAVPAMDVGKVESLPDVAGNVDSSHGFKMGDPNGSFKRYTYPGASLLGNPPLPPPHKKENEKKG